MWSRHRFLYQTTISADWREKVVTAGQRNDLAPRNQNAVSTPTSWGSVKYKNPRRSGSGQETNPPAQCGRVTAFCTKPPFLLTGGRRSSPLANATTWRPATKTRFRQQHGGGLSHPRPRPDRACEKERIPRHNVVSSPLSVPNHHFC